MLNGEVDKMLASTPVGAGSRETDTWSRMKPLKFEIFEKYWGKLGSEYTKFEMWNHAKFDTWVEKLEVSTNF